MRVPDSATPSQETLPTAAGPRLSWPPPGLEPLLGVGWPIVRSFALGVMLFALPLLVAIGFETPFWSLGPFGHSYWIPAVTAVLSLGLLLDASIKLSRAIRLGGRGARFGYGLGTILSVAADDARDTGFVLQGARAFSTLTASERRQLLAARVAGQLAYLFACMWIPAGLALGIILALNGWLTSTGLWLITLLPAVMLGLAGMVFRTAEATHSARARKRSRITPVDDALADETRQWREDQAVVAGDVAIGSKHFVKRTAYRLAAILVVVPAVLLIVPVVATVGTIVMGPVLASIAVPKFGQTERRMRASRLLSEYLLAPDPTITPQEAGQALMNLAYAGGRKPSSVERPPTRIIDNVVSELDGVRGLGPLAYQGDTLLARLRSGSLTDQQRTYLQQLAASPLHEEVRLIAHAPGVDALGAQFVLPLPDSIMLAALPIPRFGNLRNAAHAHVIKGYQELAAGRVEEAERLMKETLTAGYRMSQDAPILITALIGTVIVGIAADGLERVYRAAGRTAEADVLAAKLKARDMFAERSRHGGTDVNAAISEMPQIVTDTTVSRALRWELFAGFNTFAGCLSLRRAVFRDDRQYESWLEQARGALVRYPSDAELFERARLGWLATPRDRAMLCQGVSPRMMKRINVL